MSTTRSNSAYQQVSIALQHAGITADEYMTMYRSHSNQHSSKSSKKRKSSVPHEHRFISTSMLIPTEPLSNRDMSRATVEMSRKQAASAPASIALARSTFHTSIPNTIPPQAAWQTSDVPYLQQPSMSRKVSRHVNTTWQDPDEFLASVNPGNIGDQNQPNYTTTRVPEHYSFDTTMLSPMHAQQAWSPISNPVDLTDSSSLPSAEMSRAQTQSSFSSISTDVPLTEDPEMLHVKSDSSYMSPSTTHAPSAVPSDATAARYPYPPYEFSRHDYSHSTDPLTQHHPSLISQADGFDTVSASKAQQSAYNTALSMQRDFFSSSSSSSRSHMRYQETPLRLQSSIAPALNHHSSSSFNDLDDSHQQLKSEQMIRVTSENGEEKVMIPKHTERQKRPTPLKLLCPHCRDHPDGFRGEHELNRHMSRAHSKVRKVWLCVDSSADGKFLANCKACRSKKRYGAYYNAAAHLRRAHFNPRKKGRKTKGEEHEKRGGKGGGNWPPMNDLKEHWLREIEEIVADDAPSPSDDFDDEAGDDIDLGLDNDCAEYDYPILSTIDSSALNFTGAGFTTSPMNAGYSPNFTTDLNNSMLNVSFVDRTTLYEADIIPQSASILGGDHMLFDVGPDFLSHQPMAYAPI